MSDRLQPVNLVDFTGGLNLFSTDFQLAENESPEMLNMTIDPRGGFVTRSGWAMWNDAQVIASPTDLTWRPRNAEMHLYSNGSIAVFVTNANKIWAAGAGGAFVDLGAVATASPHLADASGWGDVMYFACGFANQAWKVTNVPTAGNKGAVVPAAVGGATPNWNNDYTVPGAKGPVLPKCEHMEPHGGYMFVAGTSEDGVNYPNRVRWSHPDRPEDWALADFIDILAGGSRITALRSFQDHLLIFKVDSVWALFGYDRDSWQLIKVSRAIGTPGPASVSKSESTVYFYSASGRNGIYAYQGGEPVLISERIRRATDAITDDREVYLGWAARRLYCQIDAPLDANDGNHGSMFVFDPSIGGQGAWRVHKPAKGTMGPIVEHSDSSLEYPLIATCGCTGSSGVMRTLARAENASDVFLDGTFGFKSFYRTSWQHAGWPERMKSWLRPRVIVRVPIEPVTVRVDTFWNYDSTNIHRSHIFNVDTEGAVFWRELGAADPRGDGWDWGDGTKWTAGPRRGDLITRPQAPSTMGHGTSLGWARAVSLKFAPDDYTLGLPWSVDAVILKFNARRFTT